MIAMHAAQQERLQTTIPAELEELPRVRQFRDGILHLLQLRMEPDFKLRHRNIRQITFIKLGEGKAKLAPKLLNRQFGNASLAEHIVSGTPNRGQIIDQRPRPVEDD